jgi:FMN phosphatase YigB (HAD superfamily)
VAPPEPLAVTFDLWHTLVYLGPRAEERYIQRQAELAVEVLEGSQPLPGARPLGRAGSRTAFDRERRAAVEAADAGRAVTVAEQFARAAASVGRVGRSDDYLARLEAEVRRMPFRRTPGGLEALRRLHEDGYRTAVVSNTVGEPGEFLRPVLRSMGLGPLLDGCYFSDELGWAKPSARIFRIALGDLGTRPSRAVHVGDGWSDVEGARRARLRAVVRFTGQMGYAPSYRAWFAPVVAARGPAPPEVDRLDQVPALVRRLLPPARSR